VSKDFTGRAGWRRPATRTPALRQVDLEVAAGSFVSLIGPSGCGKSTLLRIVAGLVAPDAGRVSILGRSPEDACADKQIGLVPQSPALLPWRSVLDNVKLPLQVNASVGPVRSGGPVLDPVALLGSVGLGAVLDRRPAQLSGGMQQRVAIARAFVFGAPILLMDEPFSALDELTRETLRLQLLELWQLHRKTVLFVTHSVAEAVTLSDRVVVMTPGPGRITADVEVDLPRPRGEGLELSDAFVRVEATVRAALRRGRTDAA
jgi:NitT/TauT family transport system ATP-binding protein